MGRSHQVPRSQRIEFGPDADDSGCRILHVDMDAFYASVEIRRQPQLRGKPVVVGGVGPRGVVSAASYEARRYGIRSAMPSSRARRLCPQAVFLPPDFTEYAAASRAVMQIFGEVTPLVEPLSMDEAFLDVAGARRLLGSPAQIAALIRGRIAAEQRLTCSVGVAPTKFVAKVASAQAKPDGMAVVPADRVLQFLRPLPVAVLWGVGERSAEVLQRLGLITVADLAAAPHRMLSAALGEAAATHLGDLANGRDPRPVNPDRAEKSISAETTFDTDVAFTADAAGAALIRRTVLALATRVASRVRASGQLGRTVAIKVRLADFKTLSRSRTLDAATDVGREIFQTAWSLLQAMEPGDRIRLVGVRVEGLSPADGAARQLALGARERGWREAEQAADAALARFGTSAVRPASLLTAPGGAPDRIGDGKWSGAPPAGAAMRPARAAGSEAATGPDAEDPAGGPPDPIPTVGGR